MRTLNKIIVAILVSFIATNLYAEKFYLAYNWDYEDNEKLPADQFLTKVKYDFSISGGQLVFVEKFPNGNKVSETYEFLGNDGEWQIYGKKQYVTNNYLTSRGDWISVPEYAVADNMSAIWRVGGCSLYDSRSKRTFVLVFLPLNSDSAPSTLY